MLLPFCAAVGLITICCLFVKSEPLEVKPVTIHLGHVITVLYLVLFALSIAIVFRTIPYWIGLVVIPLVLLFVVMNLLSTASCPATIFWSMRANLNRPVPTRFGKWSSTLSFPLPPF